MRLILRRRLSRSKLRAQFFALFSFCESLPISDKACENAVGLALKLALYESAVHKKA
jgi:NADH:ubiquinone oxidoreductase subunit K